MQKRSGGEEEGWDEDDFGVEDDDSEGDGDREGGKEKGKEKRKSGSREGEWESGKGRCAVTGRRVLGGTDGLRRVMV